MAHTKSAAYILISYEPVSMNEEVGILPHDLLARPIGRTFSAMTISINSFSLPPVSVRCISALS